MDLRALKDEALRLFVKGKYRKAMEAYWKLIQLEPSDPQLRLRHAEASRRAALLGRAVASYRVAAQLLAQEGHLARAQAALKMSIELAPDDPSLAQALRALEGTPRHPVLDPLGNELRRLDQPTAAQQRRRSITLETFQVTLTEVQAAPAAKRAPQLALPDLGWGEDLGEAAGIEAVAPEFTPQIRRLDPCTLAFKPSPNARWVVLNSKEAIGVRFLETLEELEPDRPQLERDFSGELLSEEDFEKLHSGRAERH